MRIIRILLLFSFICCGVGAALADSPITLESTVGFDGNYRANTLVPISVMVQNTGGTLHGEFRITVPKPDALNDRYRTLATIPAGAKQLYTLYFLPHQFHHNVQVEYWVKGTMIASSSYERCQEVFGGDRLCVVAGGNGASLSYVNGLPLTVANAPAPRGWNFNAWPEWSMNQQTQGLHIPQGGRGNRGNTGSVRVAYVNPALLPVNPEAYGSMSTLALMSTVTENTLPAGVQQALPAWVTSGGHLIITGGGAPGRLLAPFFRALTPRSGVETFTNTSGGTARTASFGAGLVTMLDYNPDEGTSNNWSQLSAFYGKVLSQEPQAPLALQLNDAFKQAVALQNIQPPNLTLIIIYLLIYLIVLVPVNYFVLKRIDKRESAWITVPAIVLVFTVGLYAIGYATKGHRLVVNMASIVETDARQPMAEAVSQFMIFSPSRTSYHLSLGETGLLASEIALNTNNSYHGYSNPMTEAERSPITYKQEENRLTVDDISVNMWDFRRFSLVHQLDMGQGFATNIHVGLPSSTPRATGTITNHTPYDFALCDLYTDGTWIASFSMHAGDTVTVEQANTQITPKFSPGEQTIFDDMQPAVKQLFSAGSSLGKGLILIGYTDKAGVPVRLNDHSPTNAMTVIVAHLD